MAPFDRLLQRINTLGCAGFVALVLIQAPGWLSGSGSPGESTSLLRKWIPLPSFTVSAASRESDEGVRGPLSYSSKPWAGPKPWATPAAMNGLALMPAGEEGTDWSSEEDARLVASRARYEASYRELRRRMSSASGEPGKAPSSETIVPFSPAPQTQYAEVSNCGAQMSEVAELTQHR
jgi:hypothetical protein